MALPCNPVHPHSHTPPFQECIALYALVVPKMLFRKHLCVLLLAPPWAWILLGFPCFSCMPHTTLSGGIGFRLGLESWRDEVFHNHAPRCSTRLFHGTGRSIQTSMALPSMFCMPCFALFGLYLAVPKMLFREHLCARFWHRLGLESCWGSGVSQPCPTVLHSTFPRYSGSSKHLWLCLLCLVLPCKLLCIALYVAVPKMLFREHLCARFWHRLGLESCWGIRCFATMPHRAPQGFSTVFRFIQTSMALPSMPCMPCKLLCTLYCLVFSGCARFWHRLGLESCWGSGVSQPLLDRAPQGFSTVFRFI